MRYLLPIERLALAYCLLTSCLAAVLWTRLPDVDAVLGVRLTWLVATVLTVAAGWRWKSSKAIYVLRHAVQLGGIYFWYPDTYQFNRCLNNLDHLFASAEQWLFGTQPSLHFAQALPQPFWSEAFNMGYWSYFPMLALLPAVLLVRGCRKGSPASRNTHATTQPLAPFSEVSTQLLGCFFIYYLLFIAIPVSGPQFYFQAIGIDAASAGHFPALGTYFSTHTDMLPGPGWSDGFFHHLVANAHKAGERPTAAFPSSHIGVSTIVLLLAYRYTPRLILWMMPFYILLCFATVYIQAHYVIDAIAGLFSAPIILWTASRLTRHL